MNRTGKRRLLKLADMLMADARKKKGIKFDLGVIAKPSSNTQPLSQDYVPPLSCGTTACAMGLAAISGEFKRAGLSYIVNIWENDISTTLNGVKTDYTDAAIRVFDITRDAANYLFSPWWYSGHTRGAKGERAVAQRIRQFVKTGKTKHFD